MLKRRGSLEWSLENTGKLVLAAMVILIIVYMSYKIISLFTSQQQDYTAKRNVELMMQRIETAKKEELTQTSVILGIPRRYEFRGYSKGQAKIDLSYTTGGLLNKKTHSLPLQRPDSCGEMSCLCVFRRHEKLELSKDGYADIGLSGEQPFKEVMCEALDVPAIEATIAVLDKGEANKPITNNPINLLVAFSESKLILKTT